jgi:hypothetical protein
MLLASSLQEERLRYYLDEGLTSVPHFDSPTTAPAFSVSSGVEPTSLDSGPSYLGLGSSSPGKTVDEESATSTCSLCAARLNADAEDDEEYKATSEGLGRDTRNVFLRWSITTPSFCVSSLSDFKYFSSHERPRQEEAEEDKSACTRT